MSNDGAAPRAAVPVSNARAEASRRNGAKSRGPRTEEGKARAAQNALKHGLRAQKYVVLPEEDAAEFAALEAALTLELAPVGALQAVLARRIAVAAWRLARADRIEVEVFAERSWGANANPGLALIRDGNGTRSFETLLRYRGAAMAEFWRALKTLKALQAEQAATVAATAPSHADAHAPRSIIALIRMNPSAMISAAWRMNPSAMISAVWRTSGPSHPRPAELFTKPGRPGRRTNPTGSRWEPAHARADAPRPNEPQPHAQSPLPGTCSRQPLSVPVAAAPVPLRADLRTSDAGGSAPHSRRL